MLFLVWSMPPERSKDDDDFEKLKNRRMERMLGAELTAHLGYDDGRDAPAGQSNRRNG